MTLKPINPIEHKNFVFASCEGCQNLCCENELYISQFLFQEAETVTSLFPIFFQKQVAEDIFLPVFFYSLKKGVPCIYLDKTLKKCTKWREPRPLSCTLFPFNVDQISKTPKFLYEDGCSGCRPKAETDQSETSLDFIKNGDVNLEMIGQFIPPEFADATIRDQRYYETLRFTQFCQRNNLFEQILVLETNLRFPVRFDADFQIYHIAPNKEQIFQQQATATSDFCNNYLNFYQFHRKSLAHINKLILAYQQHTQLK